MHLEHTKYCLTFTPRYSNDNTIITFSNTEDGKIQKTTNFDSALVLIDLSGTWGPFLERSGNFSSPKANSEITLVTLVVTLFGVNLTLKVE